MRAAWVYCLDCGEKLQRLYFRERGRTANRVVRGRFYCARCDKVFRLKMEEEGSGLVPRGSSC